MPESRLQHTLNHLQRLSKERTKELHVLAFAWFAIPCISLLFLLASLDCALQFGTALLWLSTLLVIAGIASCCVWYYKLFRKSPSLAAIATLVEKVRPNAENRIINAVQFAETGSMSTPFIEALLGEVNIRIEQVQANELYSPRLRKFLFRTIPAILVLWILPFVFAPQGICTSLLRIAMPFMHIMPHTNTIISEILPGNVSLKRGETIEVRATFSGIIPQNATLELLDETDTPELFEMQPDGENARILKTHELFSTTRYRIIAGDAKSQWQTAKMAPMPGLVRWEAAVAPPPHTALPNYVLKHDMKSMEVMRGAAMIFAGLATMPLKSIDIMQGERSIAHEKIADSKQFKIKAQITGEAPVRIKIVSSEDVEATQPLPLSFLEDAAPTIMLVDTPVEHTIEKGKKFPVTFNAKDDFGISKVTLERISADYSESEAVTSAEPEADAKLNFNGRFIVDTASFDVPRNEPLRLRLRADDNYPAPHSAFSPTITLNFAAEEDVKNAKAEAAKQVEDGLAGLIKRQRTAWKDTNQLADFIATGNALPMKRLELLSQEQSAIREQGVLLLENRSAIGFLGDTLAGLVNNEMKEVVEEFGRAFTVPPSEKHPALLRCAKLQNAILAALTGIKENIANEQEQSNKGDIFEAIQKLVKNQRRNLKDTEAAVAGQQIAVEALLHNQDNIAQSILAFSNLCLTQADKRAADDFSTQLRNAHTLISKEEAYEMALEAAEALDKDENGARDLPAAVEAEKKVLRTLLKALDILNKWRVQNAKDIVANATEVIAEVKEKLDGIEKKQAHIAEVTREMKGRPMEEVREKLAEMDKEQEEMADDIEKLANDLYQFPDLPICNELNSKMREVYEEVLQALDSENLPSVEIAVQKEDSLLDLIRSTKERIEDVEMWLPDVPDHFVWNMESFDSDEFPDMPLVPLPEELEDIVGNLLDQAEDIDMQSQDTTGNNMIADMEMGWAVMDGPMPSFSAKGKSGNTRPNDNEMTGRSGAGREGQSNGELVENHVKGYEGRETHARKTQDKFQSGIATEDEDSTLKARATGGGKLGAQSETEGMFGNAPRRDLNMGSHGKSPQKLRQETEVLYASARLLFLGAGGLSEAARDLRKIENKPPDIGEVGSLRRRIMRQLEDSQVQLHDGTVLSMPVSSIKRTGGSAVNDSDIEKLADEYKTMLNSYYQGLAQ